MAFETLLLVSGKVPETDPVLNMLKGLGFADEVVGTARPRVGLRPGARAPTLVAATSAEADAFFDAVFACRREPLRAFSLTPPRQLEMLFLEPTAAGTAPGKIRDLFFTHGGRTIRAAYPAAEQLEASSSPYARHLVEFAYHASAAQGSGNVLPDEVPVETELLMVLAQHSPLRIADDQAINLSRNALAGLCQSHNCLVLPPVLRYESIPDKSYFAHRSSMVPDQPTALAVRDRLRQAWKLAIPHPTEPSVVTLWRLTDDPALRDALREGGSLKLSYAGQGPSRVELIMSSAVDPVAEHRRAFLAKDLKGGSEGWAVAAQACIREGIASLVVMSIPGGAAENLLEISVAPADVPPAEWTIEPQPSSPPAEYPQRGAWNLLFDVCAKVADAPAQGAVRRETLLNTAAHDRFVPDHECAIRSFIASFWRCPWDRETNPGPWRDAASRVLEWIVSPADAIPPPEERCGIGEWPRFSQDPFGGVVMIHLPTDHRVEEYRLLLPVGATLLQGGVMMLDDSHTALDDGFVLA